MPGGGGGAGGRERRGGKAGGSRRGSRPGAPLRPGSVVRVLRPRRAGWAASREARPDLTRWGRPGPAARAIMAVSVVRARPRRPGWGPGWRAGAGLGLGLAAGLCRWRRAPGKPRRRVVGPLSFSPPYCPGGPWGSLSVLGQPPPDRLCPRRPPLTAGPSVPRGRRCLTCIFCFLMVPARRLPP